MVYRMVEWTEQNMAITGDKFLPCAALRGPAPFSGPFWVFILLVRTQTICCNYGPDSRFVSNLFFSGPKCGPF